MRLPSSSANEKFSNLFVNEIEGYTNNKVKLVIVWNSCKIQSLFNYKDNLHHHSCVIYHSVCSCGADYIGETIRNAEIRWKEYSTGRYKHSDCVKHLNDNFSHKFQWFVLSRTSKSCLKHK